MNNYLGMIYIDDCYYNYEDVKEKVKHINGAFTDDNYPYYILITTENAYKSAQDMFKELSGCSNDFENEHLELINNYIHEDLWSNTNIGDDGIFGRYMPFTREEITETVNIYLEILNNHIANNSLDNFHWRNELNNSILTFVKRRIIEEMNKQYKSWEKYGIDCSIMKNAIKISF